MKKEKPPTERTIKEFKAYIESIVSNKFDYLVKRGMQRELALYRKEMEIIAKEQVLNHIASMAKIEPIKKVLEEYAFDGNENRCKDKIDFIEKMADRIK